MQQPNSCTTEAARAATEAIAATAATAVATATDTVHPHPDVHSKTTCHSINAACE